LRKSSIVWIWQHEKRRDDYKIILNFCKKFYGEKIRKRGRERPNFKKVLLKRSQNWLTLYMHLVGVVWVSSVVYGHVVLEGKYENQVVVVLLVLLSNHSSQIFLYEWSTKSAHNGFCHRMSIFSSITV
jgi:hypothetical protein